MKNLAKIFTVVVAGMLAFSCVTDTTEDLGVNVGGMTTVNLSLEEARTQLGAEVDGNYPLYWSADDKISVNGIESQAAKIDSENAANAEFDIPGTLSSPYCVAYPAAAEGQVKFAAEQTHADNATFGSGVSTMYAYSESLSNFHLQHLTGVLKIGVTGEATITKAQISTIDRAPIAGDFDIDFATGKVTPSNSATEVINYSFATPVTLTAEPTYIHVAVPAGKYDELYVTLYDNAGGVMYATVKAGDSNPLAAGDIRTFRQNIPYAANAEVFIISNVETLQKFAEEVKASTAEAPFVKDVVLVEDVDASGITWTSLDWDSRQTTTTETPSEEEGGTPTVTTHTTRATFHGNGYAIKGLNAPLFGILGANVKGLHLEDVAITSTATYAGTFACQLYGELRNCSTSGTFTYNSTAAGAFVGGFAGVALDGASFYNCVNECDFTLYKNHQLLYPGGICACVGTSADSVINNVVVFENCHNKGDLIISAGKGSTSRNTYMGGILGSSHKAFSMHKCTNSGRIEHGKISTKNAHVGGIYGRTYTAAPASIVDCHNYGDIVSDTTCNEGNYVAGGISYISFPSYSSAAPILTTIKNVTNSGTITLGGTTVKGMFVGGVVGEMTSFATQYTIEDLSNSGAINASGTSSIYAYCGGVIAKCGTIGTISGLHNTGVITSTVTTATSAIHGGVFANTGVITSLSDVSNSGAVNVDITAGTTEGTTDALVISAAGVFGYCTTISNLSDVHNTGAVSANITTTDDAAYVGGVFAKCLSAATATMDNVTNNAAVTFSGTIDRNAYLGGVAGYFAGDEKYITASNFKNLSNGTVTMKADVSAASVKGSLYSPRVGGVFGLSNYVNMSATSNAAAVVWSAEGKALTAYSGHEFSVGGISGAHAFGAVDNCNNSGNVTLEADNNTQHHHVGGCFGQISCYASAFKNVRNTGNIHLTSTFGTTRMRLGGLAGVAYRTDLTDSVNKGNITYDATESANQMFVGGAVGYHYTGSGDNINHINTKNAGKLTINKGTKGNAADIRIAGIVAFSNVSTNTTDIKGCVNVGDIEVNLDPRFTAVYIAGIVGYHGRGPKISDCQQFSTIKAMGWGNRIGGITGRVRTEYSETETTDEDGKVTITKNYEIIAKNCQIGGTLIFSETTKEEEDANGGDPVMVTTPDYTHITAENWHEYLYFDPIERSVAEADGCSHLAVKPTVE